MGIGQARLDSAMDARLAGEADRLRQGASGGRERAREVAEQFESLFIQTMLKSMRDATPGESLFGSNAVDQYQSLFDERIAKDMANGRGMGLASMVERQILRQQGSEPEPPPVDRALQAADRFQGPPSRGVAPALGPTAPGLTATMGPSGFGETPVEAGGAGAAQAAGQTPAAAPRREALADSPRAFVERLWPEAKRVAAELDVDPRALVAQSALETGWGQHVLKGKDGSSSHNVFNIKAHRDWQGETVTVPTLEYRNGEAVRERASFRAYDSLGEAFDDYAAFLQQHPRYSEALQAGQDAGRYVEELQKAGYATDPAYAEKIRRILDEAILSRGPEAFKSGPDGPTT